MSILLPWKYITSSQKHWQCWLHFCWNMLQYAHSTSNSRRCNGMKSTFLSPFQTHLYQCRLRFLKFTLWFTAARWMFSEHERKNKDFKAWKIADSSHGENCAVPSWQHGVSYISPCVVKPVGITTLPQLQISTAVPSLHCSANTSSTSVSFACCKSFSETNLEWSAVIQGHFSFIFISLWIFWYFWLLKGKLNIP